MRNAVDALLYLVDELQQCDVIADDDGRWNDMLELDAQIEEQAKTFPDVPYPESADIETIGFCRIPYMSLMYGRSLMTHPGYLRVAEPWRQAMRILRRQVREEPDNEPLASDSPEAASFQYEGQWCTASFLKERFGLSGQQLSKAATLDRPPNGIRIERRKARVAEGRSGKVFVYHAGQAMLLANKLNADE